MTAGRSDAYWARRAEGRRLDLLRDAERAADEIGRAYLEACRQLQDEADKIFRAFRRNGLLSEVAARRLLNQYPDASARELIKRALATMPDGPDKRAALAQVNAPAYQYRIGRLEQLRRTIGERLGVVAQRELEVSTRSYVSTLQEAYYRHLYDVQRGAGLGFGVADFSPQRLCETLAQRWSGQHYSARIWENAQALAERLRADLMAAALSGRSERDIARQIERDYQAGAYASRRLVRTESAYLAGQADQLAYEELRIDRYRYLATLDMRTSSLCQGLDGRQFARSQAKVGVNYPPMHPNCRSTTVAVIDDEALEGMTRRARDPDTGEVYEVPADMTYRQWMAARKLKKTGVSDLRFPQDSGQLNHSLKTDTPILVGGVKCKITRIPHAFSDGSGHTRNNPQPAVVYTVPDGTQFIFPESYDILKQTMTPEFAISAWQRVPLAVREKAQKTVEFVEYLNPQDEFWRRHYKNFSQSYATGGETITFYRWEEPHDRDYVTRTYCHEAGHYIDRKIASTTAGSYSSENAWTLAAKEDKLVSRMKSITKYGENSAAEDFAESLAEFVMQQMEFVRIMPNRAKLIKDILGL